MKTKNLIFLLFIALMFYGCGSKDNKTGGSSGVLSNAYGPLSGGQSAELSQIRSQYPCSSYYSQNPQRIPDVVFSSSYSTDSQYLPGGQLQQGRAGGSVTGVYAGRSPYNDIIVVETMSGGGFNVIVSYCTYQYYIETGSTVQAFALGSSGATLRTNTGCSVGQVIANYTTALISNPNSGYGSYGSEQVQTTFEPVYCNNGSYQQTGGGYYSY